MSENIKINPDRLHLDLYEDLKARIGWPYKVSLANYQLGLLLDTIELQRQEIERLKKALLLCD